MMERRFDEQSSCCSITSALLGVKVILGDLEALVARSFGPRWPVGHSEDSDEDDSEGVAGGVRGSLVGVGGITWTTKDGAAAACGGGGEGEGGEEGGELIAAEEAAVILLSESGRKILLSIMRSPFPRFPLAGSVSSFDMEAAPPPLRGLSKKAALAAVATTAAFGLCPLTSTATVMISSLCSISLCTQ